MSGDSRMLDDLIKGYMIPSPHQSSRRGQDVLLICFHTAEGATNVESLGAWFQRPSAKVSSQVGIDDRRVARYVREDRSSWAAGNANSRATQAELCAFARWTVKQWEAHPNMLELAARWAAACSIFHGIPLVRVRGADTRYKTGVCMHIDCTRGFGGNHVDCGEAFSSVILDRIIARARQIAGGGAGGFSSGVKDDLEALMATIDDKNYPSPLPKGVGDPKASIAGMIQQTCMDAYNTRQDVSATHSKLNEVAEDLKQMRKDLGGHLATPNLKNEDGSVYHQTLTAHIDRRLDELGAVLRSVKPQG